MLWESINDVCGRVMGGIKGFWMLFNGVGCYQIISNVGQIISNVGQIILDVIGLALGFILCM